MSALDLNPEQYDTAYRLWETNPAVTAPTQAMCQQYAVEQGGTYEQAREALLRVYEAFPPGGSRAAGYETFLNATR